MSITKREILSELEKAVIMCLLTSVLEPQRGPMIRDLPSILTFIPAALALSSW